MMLWGKTQQDIKAIDLMASPTDISPAEDIDRMLGPQRMGLGPLARHSLLTPSLASFP